MTSDPLMTATDAFLIRCWKMASSTYVLLSKNRIVNFGTGVETDGGTVIPFVVCTVTNSLTFCYNPSDRVWLPKRVWRKLYHVPPLSKGLTVSPNPNRKTGFTTTLKGLSSAPLHFLLLVTPILIRAVWCKRLTPNLKAPLIENVFVNATDIRVLASVQSHQVSLIWITKSNV